MNQFCGSEWLIPENILIELLKKLPLFSIFLKSCSESISVIDKLNSDFSLEEFPIQFGSTFLARKILYTKTQILRSFNMGLYGMILILCVSSLIFKY